MGVKCKAWLGVLVVSLLCISSHAASNGDLRLVEAVKNRDSAAVRILIKQQADVNAAQLDGATALHWAAHWDDLETAELLIRAGANVNAANDYGVTPLSLACTNRNSAMIEKLLKARADPNAAQWTGETAFMTCVRAGNPHAVKLMLNHGANLNAKTRRGQTALMWAAAQKRPEVVQALIHHGSDVNATTRMLTVDGFTPPQYYTWGLYDHVTGEPARYDPTDFHLDPASSRGGYTPLLFAARAGDLESARLLVAAGADVNAAGPDGSPLVMGSASGHQALAIFLLEKGADPNAADGWGITALHWAVQEGLAAITAHRQQSSSTDHLWRRPNMPELVKALLEHGVNPNARIVKGPPPFIYPPFDRSTGETRLDLPRVRSIGATPFFLAAAAADVNVMRILLAGGADPRLATDEGTTPLMVAAGLGPFEKDRPKEKEKDALKAVLLAVELGNDVNAVTTGTGGRTALHGAAYMGANDIIRFLVERGARLDAEDKYGQTPLSIALGDPELLVDEFDKRFRIGSRPRKDTADLLLQLGATPVSPPATERLESSLEDPVN